jgi:hypothetical protein
MLLAGPIHLGQHVAVTARHLELIPLAPPETTEEIPGEPIHSVQPEGVMEASTEQTLLERSGIIEGTPGEQTPLEQQEAAMVQHAEQTHLVLFVATDTSRIKLTEPAASR